MEIVPTESGVVMGKETREEAAIRRGITGEPMDGETEEEAFKRRSVPYHLMDPLTKIEFEASADSNEIWNDDGNLEMTAEEIEFMDECFSEFQPGVVPYTYKIAPVK